MSAQVGNTYAEGNEGGRPSLYRDEYAEQAYKLCLVGYTDKELASFFKVTEQTINNWKSAHQEFFESISRGKEAADMEVVLGLYNSAIGATWYTEKAFKVKRGPDEEEVEVVKLLCAAPPDVKAAQLWLTNRQARKWRNKQVIENEQPDSRLIRRDDETGDIVIETPTDDDEANL